MKCKKCGYENNDAAKFCTKCGELLNDGTVEPTKSSSNNTKYAIIALVIVIVILVACIGYFVGTMNSTSQVQGSDANQNASSESVSSGEDTGQAQTQSVSSSKSQNTQTVDSKSWESIGSYSGSGSGSQTISVPAGKIMVKLSAYPIKNYATNHLYVTGSNGQSGGVDWGSHSDVETRSDSFTYTSSSSQTFEIDYYETVSWQVEFFRYQ